MDKEILLYENWSDIKPRLLGRLYVSSLRGRETYAFAYDSAYLREKNFVHLDPYLSAFAGRQYPENGRLWGFLSDACPDRWGRTLMKRREALRAAKERHKPRTLLESDFLLGVHDEGRAGALRFCLQEDGPFLSDESELAAPPWVALRKLETASLAIEDDSGDVGAWLKILLAPGSSLGGARPKAVVTAPDKSLWIAKFPSRHDEYDAGAWEMVAHELARLCNLDVPAAQIAAFSDAGTTFLVQRFDRKDGRRLHFASAMTMLGKTDNDHEASYLDLVDFLRGYGSQPKKDLEELWRRLVFNMLISNTDDHLRNHGFLLSANGWRLSPLYDVNPVPYGNDLSLGVTYEETTIAPELALETAEFYGLSRKAAEEELKAMAKTVAASWRDLAHKCHIQNSSIEQMSPAFSLAENLYL